MEIMLLQESDAGEAALLEKRVFSIPWSKNSFADAATNKNTLYLKAVIDGEMVGYVGAWLVMGEAEITNVCVKPEFRKMHIAEQLMNELVNRCRSLDTDIFFLEVRMSNIPAIRLYEKLGFGNIGIRKNFYERPVEDAIVMSKTYNSHL